MKHTPGKLHSQAWSTYRPLVLIAIEPARLIIPLRRRVGLRRVLARIAASVVILLRLLIDLRVIGAAAARRRIGPVRAAVGRIDVIGVGRLRRQQDRKSVV